MPADPLLSIFPAPLLRLILCGGEGLPAAWGPLHRYDGAMCAWDPLAGRAHAHNQKACDPFMDLDGYLLPLDHWRPRLALVAAWMLGWDIPAAYIQHETEEMHLSLMCLPMDPTDSRVISPGWDSDGGYQHDDGFGPSPSLDRPPNLPTLPAHLATHVPAVALLLALYDAPEIRARLATG